MTQGDTIIALATPSGIGAIAVIRLSGMNAINMVHECFVNSKNKMTLREKKSHTLSYGIISNNGSVIDEIVVSLFRAPHSYTGEDIIEIACHGSPYIQEQIIHLFIEKGARLAQPGEFTQRAFLNGKLDLVQAEAVADLIASENKATHQIALNQMRGGISTELQNLRNKLINFTALIELELDFSDEDIEFADRDQLYSLIQKIKTQITSLIASFEYGNAIKQGVPVAIIGKPNAGKSSLLNMFLSEERALVSDVAGTTRDTIEETMTLEGIKYRFIDTAGIRQTDDLVEAMGVERAKEKLKTAKVVLHLYEDDCSLLNEIKELIHDKIVFNIKTKVDISGTLEPNEAFALSKEFPHYEHLAISVKTQKNIDKLLQKLSQHFKNDMGENALIITNVRHKEALVKSLNALNRVEEGMNHHISGDMLSFHLNDVLLHLGSISGKIELDRDILGAIFSQFCIGK